MPPQHVFLPSTIPTKRSRTASSVPSLVQLDKKTKRAGVVEELTEALKQSGEEILQKLPYLCQAFSGNKEQMAILERWYNFLTLPLDQQLLYTHDKAKELLERPNINATHERMYFSKMSGILLTGLGLQCMLF
ncbi:hypothetical protein EST38_g14161 [Candolleomyces aberdarensis]|uniref:Uncharacterized protein n=1 Tax=Candolleomyces aberdarensis TaxID=2316362 RepID=A0A4Q2CY44_9AGAR|nr:hypothetical protein EST38_g14161 [Candolleomyces aberdarensis]